MTNKLLLAAIALGLFANAAATLVRPARADVDPTTAGSLGGVAGQLSVIANVLERIEIDIAPSPLGTRCSPH